ncbi:MAG: cell division protein FtsA, partial [Thiotrichales bacterium]|nr:cell division protein FtsA [Thiotrichales bacterium]
EELVRGYFSKRVKIGKIQRSRISGLETILTDYKYTGSIGLLLHEGDLNKAKFIVSNKDKSVMGKLKKAIVGNF